MKKGIRNFILGFLTALIAVSGFGVFAASNLKKINVELNSLKVLVNSKVLTGGNIVYGGNVYINAKSISDRLGKSYVWDNKAKTVTIKDKTIITTNNTQANTQFSSSDVVGYWEGTEGRTADDLRKARRMACQITGTGELIFLNLDTKGTYELKYTLEAPEYKSDDCELAITGADGIDIIKYSLHYKANKITLDLRRNILNGKSLNLLEDDFPDAIYFNKIDKTRFETMYKDNVKQ